MREVVELDDGSLLHILSKVGDAGEIARFSAVSKRWRELRWSVSYIAFSFAAVTQEELRRKEDIISSVLYRTKSKSPGSLKHLSVTLSCHQGEAACHWLVWASGLEKLQIQGKNALTWGPALWNSVAFIDTINTFMVAGFSQSSPPSSCLRLKNLRRCDLTNGASASLLHVMFAACPALEQVAVGFFKDASIRVASASLKIFQLFGLGQAFKVILDAPRLAYLGLGSLRRSRTGTAARPSIQFGSTNLRELTLRMPCALNDRCDSLEILTIMGLWEVEKLADVLKFTPMISELRLRFRPSSMNKISIDNVFAPLVTLRNIHLNSAVVEYLEGGVTRLAAVDAHMWPDEVRTSYDTRLLRDLLEVHKVRSIVVHCKDLMDHPTKTVKQKYSSSRDLFDLLLFYPDRVKLCRT